MPVWLQMIAALSSALLSGIMGIALIPFLQKCRFCDPEPDSDAGQNQNADAVSGNRLKPTMCGILLMFGCTAGFVLSYTLYMQFMGADRTGTDFQTESHVLRMMLLHGILFGIIGWVSDYVRTVLRRPESSDTDLIVIFVAFFTSYSFLKFYPEEKILDFGFFQWEAGVLSVPVRAVLLTLFWYSVQKPEQNVDGADITVSTVQLLFMTVLSIAGKQNLNALYALTTAGACLGCFYWNLYPAKCRLGQTGTYWLGITVPLICLHYHRMDIFLLYLTAWLINSLPLLFKKKTLLYQLREDGKSPVQRILILTAFALFCSVMSVMPEHT
ncbi:MAG: hypothetical protein IJJ69_02615 [Oscillospiraceae bacterium]|nr:hypothetical protein [Oscillospiraceae bacterium]